MYHYLLHGINIQSEIKLSQLSLVQSTSYDAEIRLSDFDPFKDEALKEGINFRVTENAVFLFWKDIGSIKIKDGTEILINPEKNQKIDIILPFILGPALAVLLHQRKKVILHASAVEMNGEAVAFMGDTGFGKSTTAMILQRKGHPMVSDDILSVNLTRREYPTVNPGTPVIKLRYDVTELLKEEEHIGKIFYENPIKKFYQIKDWTNKKTLRLKSIYILKNEDEINLETYNGHEAFLALIANSFLIRLFNKQEKLDNFRQCHKIIEKVPIKLLSTGKDLENLDNLADIIIKEEKK